MEHSPSHDTLHTDYMAHLHVHRTYMYRCTMRTYFAFCLRMALVNKLQERKAHRSGADPYESATYPVMRII